MVDSATGAPVQRAGVQAQGWMGLARTDSLGRFRMTRVPLNSELRLRCPATRRFTGRIAYRQPLQLPAGVDTQIVALIGAGSCVEPPERSVRVELRGHYAGGFESSEFRPCGGLPPEGAVYGDRGGMWTEFAEPLRGRTPKWPTFPDTTQYPTVYVRWRGTLTGPGSYGHLGSATYELLVDEILEVRRIRKTDCQ